MANPNLERRRLRWVLVGCVVAILLSAVPTIWERIVAAPHLRTEDSVPRERVAIVLGARVVGDRPTAFLAGRLDLALRLFQRHTVDTILVSGNNDRHGYDEPDVMRAYLVARGVPGDRILVDESGFDTWATCVRARRVFGVERAILVTQAFHIARAVALCRANGVDGYGVGIDSASVGLGSTVYGYVREYFAAGKALWQVLTH